MKSFLPNFLCIGAQKSGTTTLHDILIQHPDIYLPKIKETHFFDLDDNFNQGVKWWIDTYYKKFNNEKIIGDFTPEYLFYDEIPEKIYNILGDQVKFLIILRNPVDRAYSHYLMSVNRGFESLSFFDAIQQENKRISNGPFERNHLSYLSRGYYSKQIKRYINLFPKENIHFCLFENDLLNNRKDTIDKILEFLRLEIRSLNIYIKRNEAFQRKFKFLNNILYTDNKLKELVKMFLPMDRVRISLKKNFDLINRKKHINPKLNASLRYEILKKYYLDDIVELETLIARDLSKWKL